MTNVPMATKEESLPTSNGEHCRTKSTTDPFRHTDLSSRKKKIMSKIVITPKDNIIGTKIILEELPHQMTYDTYQNSPSVALSRLSNQSDSENSYDKQNERTPKNGPGACVVPHHDSLSPSMRVIASPEINTRYDTGDYFNKGSVMNHSCASSSRIQTPINKTPKWERVLWKKQQFNDNHMPLQRLVSVIYKGPRNTLCYNSLLARTAKIAQPLQIVIIFIYLDKGLSASVDSKGRLYPRHVFLAQLIFWVMFVGYHIIMTPAFMHLFSTHTRIPTIFRSYVKMEAFRQQSVKSSSRLMQMDRGQNAPPKVMLRLAFDLMLTAILYIFGFTITVHTDIVRNLSTHISSDSASNMAGLLLIALVFQTDYGTSSQSPQNRFDPSMTFGIMCGLLMASRMDEPMDAFAILSSSVMLFAVVPVVRKYLMRRDDDVWNIIVTPSLFITTSQLMKITDESMIVKRVVLLSIFFTIFIVPILYLKMQKRQIMIRGPWDIPMIVPTKRSSI